MRCEEEQMPTGSLTAQLYCGQGGCDCPAGISCAVTVSLLTTQSCTGAAGQSDFALSASPKTTVMEKPCLRGWSMPVLTPGSFEAMKGQGKFVCSSLRYTFVINQVKILPYKWKLLESYFLVPAAKPTRVPVEAVITAAPVLAPPLGLASGAPSRLVCWEWFQVSEPQRCLHFLPLLVVFPDLTMPGRKVTCAATEMFCPREWLEDLKHVQSQAESLPLQAGHHLQCRGGCHAPSYSSAFAVLWLLLHPGSWRPSPPSCFDGFVFLSRIDFFFPEKETDADLFSKENADRSVVVSCSLLAFPKDSQGAEREDYEQCQRQERLLLRFLAEEGGDGHPRLTNAAPHCLLVAKMHPKLPPSLSFSQAGAKHLLWVCGLWPCLTPFLTSPAPPLPAGLP